MKRTLSITLLGVSLFACNDDETVKVDRDSDDYMPNTVGSFWSYTSSFFSFTQKATSGTRSIDGKAYFEYMIEFDGLPSFKVYARKDGNSYINRETYPGQYDDGEYIFLKDAGVGTDWTEVSYDDEWDVETTDELEIMEVGGTYEVNGEIFTNVIVVRISSLSEGATEPYILDYYYAKGVGLIQILDEFDFVTTELLDYAIVN